MAFLKRSSSEPEPHTGFGETIQITRAFASSLFMLPSRSTLFASVWGGVPLVFDWAMEWSGSGSVRTPTTIRWFGDSGVTSNRRVESDAIGAASATPARLTRTR